MNKNIIIGGAWPYANSSLHLGHIAGLISGDVLARYHRWCCGLTGIKLKNEIIDFCEKATNLYNDISYESKIDYACNLSKRLFLIFLLIV